MEKWVIIVIALVLAINISACSEDDSPSTTGVPGKPNGNNNNNEGQENPDPNKNSMKLVIKINSAEFTATPADSATAEAFKEMLPMTVNMTEHARNEKYYELSKSLPANAANPGTIRNGDIMLYGSRTLVLFYKTFSTSYTYTGIGYVDNPSGLESALENGSVTVSFELIKEEI